MSINLFADTPAAVVAKTSITFADAGITADNTYVIYLVGDPMLSYEPGRDINSITGFVSGKGYYIVPKSNMDLTAILIPPIAGITQLSTPGTFTVTAGNAQNVLDWANVTDATSYTVDRATNSGFTTGVSLNIYTGSTSAYTDTGRTNGTQYFYRVKATASGFTDSNYATGNGTPSAGMTQLAAPTSFMGGAASDTVIVLGWNAPPNATGYVVDRATNSGFTTGVSLGIYTGGFTAYNDTSRTASTQYFYRIRATASGYTDSNYSTANATTNAAYDSDAAALIAAIEGAGTLLAMDEKDAYNGWIVSMKSGALWGKTTAFYVLGTSLIKSKFNFKDPATNTLTNSGTITYAGNGAAGDGASSYLNTNVGITGQNSAALFVSQKGTSGGLKAAIGTINAGGGAFLLPGDPMYAIFNGSVSPSSIANTPVNGRYVMSRTSSAGFKVYKNGTVLLDASADTSAAPAAGNVLLGASGGYPSDNILSCAGVFTGLTGAEVTELDGYIQTLETALSR